MKPFQHAALTEPPVKRWSALGILMTINELLFLALFAWFAIEAGGT